MFIHQNTSKVLSAQDGKINFNKGFLGIFKPKDFDKINTALQRYNIRVQAADGRSKSFAENLAKINPELSNYLVGLKGAEGTMKGYGVHLVGATIKTVALQAASMALNAALTWGVSLAIQGLISLGTYLWKLIPTTEHLKKKLEETSQALADIKSERESLNDELKTTQERIADLEAKGVLSFTDEAELKRLNKENAALKTKIELLDIEAKKKREENQDNFNSVITTARNRNDNVSWEETHSGGRKARTTSASRRYDHIGDKAKLLELVKIYDEVIEKEEYIDGKGVSHSIEDVEKEITNFSSVIQEYQGYLDDLYQDGFDYSSADEKTKQNIDFANEMIDRYMALTGKFDTMWEHTYNSDRFSEAHTAIEKLGTVTAESLLQLYKDNDKVKEFVEYILSLGAIDWKTVLGKDFDSVAGDDKIVSTSEALGWMNEKGENSAKIMGLVANELNKVEDAAEDAETSFKSIAKTLSDGLDKLSNKKDILSEVKEELDSFGAISADNISKILEEFSDNEDVQKAVAYYLSGVGTAQQLYDVMAKGYQNDLKLQAQELTAKMQNDEKYFKSLAKLHGDFDNFQVGNQKIDLSNATSLADAKLRIENNLIETLKTNWQGYWKATSKSLDDEYYRVDILLRRAGTAFTQSRPDLVRYYQELKAAKEAKDSALKELENLTLNSFNATGFNATLSTDFDKGSGKTEAEKYFDEQKYLLETNQITQEEYLKRINQKYQQFYNKTADYLEDYAKYSQEVYDGFKDMYKEDLEAQKEAWEEKKDAVSEYYDNLREQIEDAHDKEDYEKEQSEKRKEIFDLDMQIAELMRDGSEKAKARIAELEEERLKAEEELLDFETDKAREDELSRLEKEQEAEEAKIQSQIDAIDEELQKIDGDIVDGLYNVRKTIVDYAAKKGVTLDFAYASGTRSSVGGFGRINEKGVEIISAPDGNGNYIPMLPSSYVFSAKATEFLWKLATEHSLPQAMYNSIAKSIKTQSNTPSVNIAQPITITMGDVIIKGNADKQTVADIKKQQENTVRMVLQKIKELQK